MSATPASVKPSLLHASSLLFAVTMVFNLSNYLFHAFASRMLGPADYGALVSMLAVLGIVSIPTQAVQTVVAKQAAVEELAGRFQHIRAAAVYLSIRLLIFGAVLMLGLAASAGTWRRFFRLESITPLWAVGLAAMVMLVLPVARGLLQGLQQFGHLGVNLLADGCTRLGVGVLIFWLGFGVTGGLLATVAGGLAGILVALLTLRGLLSSGPALARDTWDAGFITRDGIPVVLTFGAFVVLSSLDVMMVKHYFEPQMAGYYSAASLVGKAFIVLPYAVAQVLFPKVSANHAQQLGSSGMLVKSLGVTLTLLLASAAGIWLLARLVVITLFGSAFLNPQTLGLVKGFSLAFTPLALVYVLSLYNLALSNLKFMLWLVLDIPVLLAAIMGWHVSLEQVLWIVGINHAVVLVVGLAITPWRTACPTRV